VSGVEQGLRLREKFHIDGRLRQVMLFPQIGQGVYDACNFWEIFAAALYAVYQD